MKPLKHITSLNLIIRISLLCSIKINDNYMQRRTRFTWRCNIRKNVYVPMNKNRKWKFSNYFFPSNIISLYCDVLSYRNDYFVILEIPMNFHLLHICKYICSMTSERTKQILSNEIIIVIFFFRLKFKWGFIHWWGTFICINKKLNETCKKMIPP